MADHMQKVLKPNFAAFWEEIGASNEVEDTFSLAASKTLEGEICIHAINMLIESCYVLFILKYCKTGNFRLHFNFAKFTTFVNWQKLRARESKNSNVYKDIAW